MRLLFGGVEPEISSALRALSQSGLAFDIEVGAERVLACASTGEHDLLLLDSSDQGAFALLERVRAYSAFPILLITPHDAWRDRVRALRLGADDCISWPIQHDEFFARVDAILRRSSARSSTPEPIRIGALMLCPATKRAYLDEQDLKLTPMECEVLEVLMRKSGQPVAREQIAIRLYHRQPSPFDRWVDTHISRIRTKLGRSQRLIISVRGTGYQLCVPGDSPDTLLHEKEASG